MQINLSPLVAHRGLKSKAPENTLAAFKAAHHHGFKWVEFDVKLSKDNVPVICHDATVNRTTNGSGKIANLSYSQLKTLDAGSWFGKSFSNETIPSLEETLEFCATASMGGNIELKPDKGLSEQQLQHYCQCSYQIITKFILKHPIIVSSFNHQALKNFAYLDNRINLGLLIDGKTNLDKILSLDQSLHFYSIHLPRKMASKENIRILKDKNKKIMVYTINTKRAANNLFSEGIDAIFTDKLLPQQ